MVQIEQWVDSEGCALHIVNHENKTLNVELTIEAFRELVTKWHAAAIDNVPSTETHYSKVTLDVGED